MVSSIRTRRRTESWSRPRPQDRNCVAEPRRRGGVPAPNLPMDRVERRYAGVCLYMRQRVRIVCGEDRKDESSDMKWVKRIIVFLVVGFCALLLDCAA